MAQHPHQTAFLRLIFLATRLAVLVLLSISVLPAFLPSLQRIAHAQGETGNTISFGQTITGQITNDAFRVVYAFQGHKGDIVDATLTTTDGTLDPVLLLSDDQNTLMGKDDDSGDSFNAVIVSQQLPRDGTYFLIVTRFGQERGLTTGHYSLSLQRAGISGNSDNNGSDVGLQYGDSVVGDINNDTYQRIYAFHATRGDIISAQMQRISGNLDSLLILADAQGNVILSNDEDTNSPGTLDAAFYNLRIMTTGNYILVATRFGRQAGESKGGFSLSLDRLPPESLGKVPEKAILIDYGAVVNGSVDADNLMWFYTIEAKKGDVLIINAERTNGNLDPILALYTMNKDGELTEIASNDSGIRGQNARISGYTVPANGNYILMVSRFNRDKGITAGSYSLSLVGRTGVTVAANGQSILQFGSAVTAIVSDDNTEQRYTFTAAAGDIITINMNVTSGNLLAQLVLTDPAGKQVALDDRGVGDAKLPSLKLNVSGTYTIVATRRGRDKGTTQGTYILMLSKG